jgi:insulysin
LIISPNDAKTYLPLTLANGLRVVLIQDGNSEKSAASLTVNCGHFDDPQDRQGMAHFLEHMLFLGTQSTPQPGTFPQLISSHGGHHNAWTATEFTSFFFDVNNDSIRLALDHFSQFFREPLLAEQYIEKERHAIDAEYKLKLKEDSHRIYQVHRETINPEHPFSKFSVGNKETLADRDGVSIRQELVDFHHQHYVADRMTLVLLCPLPIAEQQALVHELFDTLPMGTSGQHKLTMPIYLPEHKTIDIFIKPHKQSQKLVVGFSLPAADHYYKNKTVGYLGHLIGFEGEGSLLSLIKAKGWCNNLSAGRGISGSNFKDFNISLELTNDGLAHTDEVISLIFQYIHLVKEGSNNEVLYKDKQTLLQLAFDYQEKTKPINQVSHISTNMFHFEQDHYVYGDYIMAGFDSEEFDRICSYLTPDNMRIIHINKDVTTNQEANWYHTPYSTSPITPQKLAGWSQIASCDPALTLPGANPYLQNSVTLESRDHNQITDIPQIITEADGFNFWFKQDEMFQVPKGHCYIAIDCPTSIASIENIAITRLFTELFLDEVVEAHYSAELAGLSYHVYVHQGGITLHTSGISTNQHILIEELLHELHHLKFSQRRYEEIKSQLHSHWVNAAKSKPVSQLFAILTSVLQPNDPNMEQMAQAIEHVSFEQFIAVKDALFTQIHVDAFCYGNWSKEQAKQLSTTVHQALFDHADPNDEVIRPILSLQHQHNLGIELDLHQYDNAIVMYYQAQCKEPRTIALFMLLNQIMAPEFFHQLRTEKQLGYLVGTGYVPLNRYPGLALYIQSPHNTSRALYQHINEFNAVFCDELEQIEAEQWQHIQHGLITQVIEEDANLRVRSQRFWMGIGNKDPQFDERDRIGEHIMASTPADLHQFASHILLTASDLKLTIKTQDDSGVPCSLDIISIEQLTQQLVSFE